MTAERAAKGAVVALCAYETVAITSSRLPTLSTLCRRRRAVEVALPGATARPPARHPPHSRTGGGVDPGAPVTSADLDRLAAEWRRVHEPPLPWPVRAKLAVHRMVDGIGLPLAARGHWRMAQRLWRLFGMWTL